MERNGPAMSPPPEKDIMDIVFDGIYTFIAVGVVTIFLTIVTMFVVEPLL